MKLEKGCLMPHPPIIVPEVGGKERNRAANTCEQMEVVAKRVAEYNPSVIFMSTPHGPTFGDVIGLCGEKVLRGSFANFGAAQVDFEVNVRQDIIRRLHLLAQERQLSTAIITDSLLSRFSMRSELDHGLMVPLYFLRQAGVWADIVPIYIGGLSLLDHYLMGMLISKVAGEIDEKTLAIASGDLSHRLTPDAPAGYSRRGQEFDEHLLTKLSQSSFADIVQMESELIAEAGECALRPLAVLLGCLDGHRVDTSIRSYEGPFGVGYAVVEFSVDESNCCSGLYELLRQGEMDKLIRRRKAESQHVKLARRTVEHFANTREVLVLDDNVSRELLERRAAVFVSIKKNGQLRGCIGTIAPVEDSQAEEIRRNALSAAFDDPRFDPVQEHELEQLVYSVDVLEEPEIINDRCDLNPKVYGVIVEQGGRRGLLLPDLEGVDTVDKQIEIACRKAGIVSQEKIKLYRFRVTRYV